MALEGVKVTINVNATEMPTTTEGAISMEVATSSNGDTMFTPNMNPIQTPNTMETPVVVEVSTSSNADAKMSANVHGMESINNMETPNAMELSTSSKVDTEMMIDGSSSVAVLNLMVDEREDSKDCKSPSSMVIESLDQVILEQCAVRVENYNEEEEAGNSPVLQDDMFSIAELSVVEDQQVDETTTVYNADIITSLSDNCYESFLGSGQNLQGVAKVTESIKSLTPIDDINGKENIEKAIGHAKVGDVTNGSIGDPGASAKHDGQVKDNTNSIPNLALTTTHVVDHENKNENGHLLPLEVYDVAHSSIDDKNEMECVHGNQVTLSKSQPEVVMVKEMNDTDSTQADRAGMKEEQESFNEHEFERAAIEEEEACQQNLPERQSEDKKVEEMEILVSGLAASINEGCDYMDLDHPSQGPSEILMQSKTIPQEIVSIKKDTGPQELSQNALLLEKDSEDSPKIPSQNTILKEANHESHTEHLESKDGDQSQEISEEFELLKGQKVSKKFGRKKFLGEVIGYDPTSKWFKVLYEDGDEEEMEKNELHSILLPVDGKLAASRKRQLPTIDDDHEDANRTGRKSIKLNMQATPRKQGKSEIAGDEITGSNQLSTSTKKRKPSAVKYGGKSKSPRGTAAKTQKAKKQSAPGKKSIEKEKSEKKTRSTQSKRKPNNQMKQSSSKKASVVAEDQNESVTRKLKYGSAMKKTSTKTNQKAKEMPPIDKEVKTPQLSMTEKSAAAISGSKRKVDTDVQGRAFLVSGKRARREVVDDKESPPLRKTQSKRRRISEDSTEVHLQVNAENNDTNEDSIPMPTGKSNVRSDKGSVLIGRKVRKDFGGELYGGVIVGYRMYYNVKYDDGDTEDLTWKELESILLPEQGVSSQPEHDKHNTQNKVNSVKSKPKPKKKN